MARTPILGGGGLSPFGGGGVDFNAFNVVDPGREAYLAYLKVKVDWEQGSISNATYLAAFQTYVNAQTAGSSNRIEAEQSLRDTTYRLERNDLLAKVEAGTKTMAELVAYDKSKLAGLDHKSQEYLDRLNLYQQTQARALSDAASAQHDLYDAGKLTSGQLRSWYRQQALNPDYAGNPDLLKNITEQIKALDLRVTSELDNHMIQQFNDGKVDSTAFLVYAAAAKARYAPGTEQARQWTGLIDDAKAQVAEKGLTYRYGLSQHYIDLQKFIKDNRDMLARAGGKGSTSSSTRIVLGADGQWKTVTSTKSTPYKPSAAEQKAMAERRIELADAERQLAETNHKIAGAGGFVTTDSMISFYSKRQSTFVKGSAEWYQVQERLDSLQQQKHQESVLRQEGVHVIYGGGKVSSGGGGASSGGGSTSSGASKNISVDAFMRSIAVSESGGNYSATNKSSGAYGKYQIMPANWPSWAQKYLGDGSLPQSPENQEKVARGKMLDLYRWLGSWDKVAHWWLTGNPNPNPSTWSAGSKRYVNAVMGRLGSSAIATTGTTSQLGTVGSARAAGGAQGTSGAGGRPVAAKGPLEIVTGVTPAKGGAFGGHPETVQTRSARFPTNLDGSAFTKFYSGFVAAFKDGQTTFTDFSSGHAITYAIPTDLAARIHMMNTLDDLRIGYYQKRAEVYAGTPSEFAAAHQYSEAIKDKADNAYLILITNQKNNAITPLGSKTPIVDPIAQGLAVQAKAEAYVKDQLAAAKLAFDRGDITGAYAHIQLAQRTMAETDAKIKVYASAADQQMQAIFRASGEKAPDKVTTDFAALTTWQNSAGLTSSLKDMDKLQGEIIGDPGSNQSGIAATDAHGNVVWANGTVQLRDGVAVFLDEAGKITYKDVPSAGYQKPGSTSQVPNIPGYVAVTMNTGGTVVGDQSGGTTVYAQWHTGVVGFTSTGAPIYGKVISGTLNGKRYTYGEDPFHPGKWNATNVTFSVPDGFSVVPGTTAGTSVYQFTGKDGATYRLDWDDKAGQYNLVKAGSLWGGTDQVLPIGDADTQTLLDGSGFKLDLSGVATGDLWQYNQNGAHPGFDASSYRDFTTPKGTQPSKPKPLPPQAFSNADVRRWLPDERQERNDYLAAAAADRATRDEHFQGITPGQEPVPTDHFQGTAPGLDARPPSRAGGAVLSGLNDPLRSISKPTLTPLAARRPGRLADEQPLGTIRPVARPLPKPPPPTPKGAAPKAITPSRRYEPPPKPAPRPRPTPVKPIAPLPPIARRSVSTPTRL